MLSINEIRKFIEADAQSDRKRFARTGLRYFEGDHDIRGYRIFFINGEGKLQEDRTKSNIKISHPFFRLLVDQQTQYMLSGHGGFVKSDIPELQTELDAYFNDNESFRAELNGLISGTVAKGWEYMYAYKDENDRTAFQVADSIGVVEVREKETDDGCAYVIRWFIDRFDKDNKAIKRIQVWDREQTWFYCQEGEGAIVPDDSLSPNPRPHILYRKDGDEGTYYDDYGMIPFFRLDNGRKRFSGLKPIKALIDDYDLMNAGLSNNIQDTNEALYVVKGFQGDNLDELMLNVKTKKHIGVDEDGGIDIKTVDIPVEARKTKMEVDEKNIFRFGQGVNTEALKDTSATVSIAIKSAYANLDLKCDGLLPFLLQFMRKLLKLVLKEINDAMGTDYEQKDVYFDFSREIITNAQENAQIDLTKAQEQQTKITTLLNTASLLGQELTAQLVCEALDLDYDDLKDKLPKAEEDPTAAALAALDKFGGDAV
ncbi:phage portal protein [Pseudoflavonifractor sp. MSJ-30]|uniref:phage portal protein n=1 Tax=Pseudoflavonifractor sp. MSJ-30 TaxID=2841525 RepID=UPI001C0F698D|nr:phage portal protein [Pseudoflavonifractor sp. MSJ-30]MBU5453321.1 phage portal protein [Pseudoflavonifractor sp. MSJ-30]